MSCCIVPQKKSPTRPLLRYHGGKWKLAPWVIEHFPKHQAYVEPFGGAASILLRKPRCYAEIYNDLDGELVNLFRVVRDRGSELKEKLYLTPFARDEFRLSYIESSDEMEQARRTVVRSFMGYGSNSHNKNTGFRSNSNRSGTTPARDWANYAQALEAIINRLRGVVIENRDAALVMKTHDGSKTLHYVDPPYVASTRDQGSDYRFEMADEDHIQLAETLHELTGMVAVSGYPSALYDNLYADWAHVDTSALADGARKRVERLWLNPAMTAALERQRAQREMFA